jgi:hypothetical protein
MDKLKPCPCGKTPKELSGVPLGGGEKWAWVCGDCCGEWGIEARLQYAGGEKAKRLAADAWNDAPRTPQRRGGE